MPSETVADVLAEMEGTRLRSLGYCARLEAAHAAEIAEKDATIAALRAEVAEWRSRKGSEPL